MPNSCCVVNCNSNYKNQPSTTVFKLLPEWIPYLPKRADSDGKPYVYPSSSHICAKHWTGFPDVECKTLPGGKKRPIIPPDYFDVPSSCIPKNIPKPRASGDIEKRQLDYFNAADIVKFNGLNNIEKRFKAGSVLCTYSETSIFLFIFDVTQTLPQFRGLVQIIYQMSTLNDMVMFCYDNCNNRINVSQCTGPNNQLLRWSQLIEAVNVVQNHHKTKEQLLQIALKSINEAQNFENDDSKLCFLSRQIELHISKTYQQCDYLFACQCYPKSKYETLRNYIIMPSSRKMRYLKSGVVAENLIEEVLKSSTSHQKIVALLVDEVKIKASLIYQGHGIFGFSEDLPTQKARSVLTVMMKCLHGGRSTVASMTPVYTLTSDILMNKVMSSIDSISSKGGHVIAMITDGLRANLTFHTLFDGFDSETPWVVRHPIYPDQRLYLLIDSVHLLKSIRNNWITEKTKRLQLEPNSPPGKWTDIENLYKSERDSILRCTPLTQASVFPSPIQRQKVSLAMKVIDDRTVAALEKFGGQSCEATVVVLKLISSWWKTVNVKSCWESLRFNDPKRKVISKTDSSTYDFLKELGSKWLSLQSATGTKRITCLTKDTKEALYKTTMGLSALAIDLIDNHDFKYVLLGELQQDRLEGEFGVWRSMSGTNYYMTAKDVDAAFRLRGLQLLASLNALQIASSCSSCTACSDTFTDDVIQTIDILGGKLHTLTPYQISCSVYIGGYVVKSTPELDNNGELADFDDSEFLQLVSRGSLIVPSVSIVSWIQLCMVFCGIMDKNIRCQKQLVNIICDIASFYDIIPQPTQSASSRLANVLLSGIQKRDKDYCHAASHSSKKVQRLSSNVKM